MIYWVPAGESLVQLQQEILKDPELRLFLAGRLEAGADMGEVLGAVAAFFNITCEGYYVPEQIAEVLVQEIRKKNSPIITTS